VSETSKQHGATVGNTAFCGGWQDLIDLLARRDLAVAGRPEVDRAHSHVRALRVRSIAQTLGINHARAGCEETYKKRFSHLLDYRMG
jgi:hypothetical protein